MSLRIRIVPLFLIPLLTLLPATIRANYLADISTYYQSPSSLPLGTTVEVACDWKWTGGDYDEEVQITAIPFTDGAPSPGLYYEGSPSYPAGSGRVWPWFTIQSGAAVVDEIRLMMETTYGKETLLEVRLPVWFHFGPHAIRSVSLSPEGPRRMAFGQQVAVDFIWETNWSGGTWVSAVPITDGVLTPNSTHAPAVYNTGSSGWGHMWFSVASGDVDVEAVRFVIWDASLTTPLFQFDQPCDYHFGSTAIQNIVLTPPSPASMAHLEYVYIDFDYVTDHPMDVKVYAIPQTDGVNSPHHSVNPPVALPPFSGSGTNRFTITADLCDVDEIWFVMRDWFDHGILIDEFRLPVYYHYSEHKIHDVELTPLAPAIMSHDEMMDVVVTYTSNAIDRGYLYTHPFTVAGLAPGLYGPYRGYTYSGMHFVNLGFQITTGEVQIDRLRIQMKDLGEAELWLSYFVDTWIHYGSAAMPTPVVEMPGADLAVLHPNYPNPFNPRTTIGYELPAAVPVDIRVFDARGRLVRTLVAGRVEAAGDHLVEWDGRDDRGRSLSSGTYLYRVRAGERTLTGSMTLVR